MLKRGSLLIAIVLLALVAAPAASQEDVPATVPATSTPLPHPAIACIDELQATAAAQSTPTPTPAASSPSVPTPSPGETSADGAASAPAIAAPSPTVANEVRTALAVDIVNAVPRLTGVVTLQTAATTTEIATLRQRTPGHREYREALIWLLSSESGVGPFGPGTASLMVGSLRELPRLMIEGDVATLTLFLPAAVSVLAYNDVASLQADPWNVATEGRDLLFRIEGRAISPDTTWWIATCFDGLSVVSIGTNPLAAAVQPTLAAAPGLGGGQTTSRAPPLMPMASDGPDRLLWKLTSATPADQLVVEPLTRPDPLTEFRLWMFTDWRWPLAILWEYAGQLLVIVAPLVILWPLSRQERDSPVAVAFRRYRIASVLMLVLLGAGFVAASARAVLLLDPPDRPEIVRISPEEITAGAEAMIEVEGRNFVDGAYVRIDDIPVVTTFVDSTRLNAEVTASDLPDLPASGERRLRVVMPGGRVETNALPLRVTAAAVTPIPASQAIEPEPSAREIALNTGIMAVIVLACGVFAVGAHRLRGETRDDRDLPRVAPPPTAPAADPDLPVAADRRERWRGWLIGALTALAVIAVVAAGWTDLSLGILAGIVPFLTAGIVVYGVVQLLLALLPAGPGAAGFSRLSGLLLLTLAALATLAIVLPWIGWVTYRGVSLWAWLRLSEDPLWRRWGLLTDPSAVIVALNDPASVLGRFGGNMRPVFANFPEAFLAVVSRVMPFIVLAGVFGVLAAVGAAGQQCVPEPPKPVRWAVAFLFGAFVVGYGAVLGFQFPIRLWLAMFLVLVMLRPSSQAAPVASPRPQPAAAPAVPSPDLGPKGDWWANGVFAMERGAILAIVPIAFYLYVLATTGVDQITSRVVPFGAVTLLLGLASELAFWLVAAFTFGSLYTLLRGPTGPVKALLLSAAFLGAYLPNLLAADATDYPWLVRAFQLALFLLALSVWLNFATTGKTWSFANLTTEYKLDDVKAAAGYVAPAVALIGAVVNQLQSGAAKDAILTITEYLANLQLPAQ